MNMKLRPNSTQQRTSNYVHPWYDYVDKLNKPNPATKEAIEKAKFIDKTFQWRGDSDLRSRSKRVSK